MANVEQREAGICCWQSAAVAITQGAYEVTCTCGTTIAVHAMTTEQKRKALSFIGAKLIEVPAKE